jgi:hypothetical protein
LGDPTTLSLKEAGEILGKARNTIYLWYRNGKFPPAVDVAPFIPGARKPVIVVPRNRLEAWQAGERMPTLLQEVFERRGLHEPPWVCWTSRKGREQTRTSRSGWNGGAGGPDTARTAGASTGTVLRRARPMTSAGVLGPRANRPRSLASRLGSDRRNRSPRTLLPRHVHDAGELERQA